DSRRHQDRSRQGRGLASPRRTADGNGRTAHEEGGLPWPDLRFRLDREIGRGMKMKELVELLAKHLVNHPDQVEVKETQGDTASVIELRVAVEDLGRIIGKQGRTAKSIRTLVNAAASRLNRKVVLEIIEDKWSNEALLVRRRRGPDRVRGNPLGPARRGPRRARPRPRQAIPSRLSGAVLRG